MDQSPIIDPTLLLYAQSYIISMKQNDSKVGIKALTCLPTHWFDEQQIERDQLRCQNCQNVPRNPVLSSEGNLYGKDCATALQLNNLITDIRSLGQIQALKLKCPIQCGWNGVVSQVFSHLITDCSKMLIQCPNEECVQQIYLFNEVVHRKRCKFQKIFCPFKNQVQCNEEFKRMDLNEHMLSQNEKHSQGTPPPQQQQLAMFDLISKRQINTEPNSLKILSHRANFNARSACGNCNLQLVQARNPDNQLLQVCNKCRQHSCASIAFECMKCHYVLCLYCDRGQEAKCQFCFVGAYEEKLADAQGFCMFCRQQMKSGYQFSCRQCQNSTICGYCRSSQF